MGKQDAVGVWTSEREPRLARLGESIGGGDGMDGAELGLLFSALASEFQGFSRDLHDETATEIMDLMTGLPLVLRSIAPMTAVQRRALNRGSATTRTVGEDFKLMGVSVWRLVQRAERERYPLWRRALDDVHRIRNASVHANRSSLASLIEEGLVTWARWQAAKTMIGELVLGMDGAVTAYLRSVAMAEYSGG